MTTLTNYPDVLGAITGGTRQPISIMHAALALRSTATPRSTIVRAGRPFELIALLQNASTVPCDVTVTLRLPDADVKRVKGSFVAKLARTVVNVLPGEVGMIVLPCACQADTAPSDTYKLALDIEVKPLGKPERIRADAGGGAFELARVSDDARAQIEALRTLEWNAGRGGARMDMAFGVAAAGGAAESTAADLKPGWISVCKLTDLNDDRILLHAFGKPMQVEALPLLKRAPMLEALTRTTLTRFGEAGMTLEEAEARAISKLLATIIEFANPKSTQHGYLAAGRYAVTPLMERNPLELPTPNMLPHWCRGLLRMIARDARAAPAAPNVVTRMVYDDLLRDGVEWGFELVEKATGEDIGDDAERALYADTLIAALRAKTGVTFNQVYLPLVMGGILINDMLLMEREDPAQLLKDVSHALEARMPTLDASDAPIQALTDVLLERTALKYGYKLN
ncbi:MAG: hypothetical protein SGI73_16810 [Chloroflexota bacterium]|nr:hypothetical protein [Chloroflexota bacterium]